MDEVLQLLLKNNIEENVAKGLAKYAELLSEANKKANLTRITSPEDVVYKHLLDSLTAVPYLKNGIKVLDIGTGGGIPGIPLAVARPDLKITMLDATENKLKFVAGFAEELHTTAKVVWGRAEMLAHGEMRGAFDAVVSRAVAALPVLTEISAAFIKKGGLFIAYKGMNAAEEAKEAASAAKKCGFGSFNVIDAKVGEFEHKLVIAEKIAETAPSIPRTWAKIKSKPF